MKVIKINLKLYIAWENDYIKDPLLAFISEIAKQLKKDDGKVKKGLNHIKQCGKKLIKSVAVTGVRLLTQLEDIHWKDTQRDY